MPLSFKGVYLIFLTRGFVWIGVRVEELSFFCRQVV
jgi:hypothetical protein